MTACASMACRSRFSRSSSAAIRAASTGSAVVKSRAPRPESPMRPPALIRGPNTKPRCQDSGAVRSKRPRRGARPAPSAAMTHHRQTLCDESAVVEAVSGTTSATVASATRSRASVRAGSGRLGQKTLLPQGAMRATSVRKTIPAAHRWPRPERDRRADSGSRPHAPAAGLQRRRGDRGR